MPSNQGNLARGGKGDDRIHQVFSLLLPVLSLFFSSSILTLCSSWMIGLLEMPVCHFGSAILTVGLRDFQCFGFTYESCSILSIYLASQCL
jgi:hypothetical protein